MLEECDTLGGPEAAKPPSRVSWVIMQRIGKCDMRVEVKYRSVLLCLSSSRSQTHATV